MRYYSFEKKDNKVFLKLAGVNPRDEKDMEEGTYWSARSQSKFMTLLDKETTIVHIYKGEVFLSQNIFPLFTLCKRIKRAYPNTKICLWTRATIQSCLKECKNNPQIEKILRLVDIVIDQCTKSPRAIDVQILLNQHRIKLVKI